MNMNKQCICILSILFLLHDIDASQVTSPQELREQIKEFRENFSATEAHIAEHRAQVEDKAIKNRAWTIGPEIIFIAARGNFPRLIEAMAQDHVNLNVRDSEGNTPLAIAVSLNNKKAVKAFL